MANSNLLIACVSAISNPVRHQAQQRDRRPGQDYFTIYDFVNAHHHFNDPEWDGNRLEPEPLA
jgi:hypothetical protein